MSTVAGLTRRLSHVESKVDVKKYANVLHDPEYALIRACIMRTLTTYPDVAQAVREAIAPIEEKGYSDRDTVFNCYFHTLENYPDARIAVARALMALKKEKESKQ